MAADSKKGGGLKKELRLFDVYAIATGTTLSAGFFLLPGLAAKQAGTGLVLAYLLAALPLIPAVVSIIELSTAFPRAGGIYFFLDRTLGPLFGTIGGVGTWLALLLKVSFALIGIGAYIVVFFPKLNILPVAIVLALVIGVLNYFGAKKSGKLQVILVIFLLSILAFFIFTGVPEIQTEKLTTIFDHGVHSIAATVGLVYISYVGITNVASLSEEVNNPEKSLPRGVILSMATALLIYVLGTAVMVGVIPMDELVTSLTPVADAAERTLGHIGTVMLSIAAIIAFISVANAGTLSASRYPLAMSRDHILPAFLTRMSNKGTPFYSLIITVGTIITFLIVLDPMKIAKLASAFQLLMFSLVCFSVIVIRESKIESYDPGYRSPLYPWMQIFGILTSFWIIYEMGILTSLFSLALIVVGVVWYFYYARKRVIRTGAIYHVFERLGRGRYEGLEREFRGILKEKGLRDEDPFDEIITRSIFLDLKGSIDFEGIVDRVSDWLCQFIPLTQQEIYNRFIEGTRIGNTPVTHDVALPHFKTRGIRQAEMVLVRVKQGVDLNFNNPDLDYQEDTQNVHGIFFLISPEDDPTQHLRILARLAGRLEEVSFYEEWLNANTEQDLKELLLRDERFLSLTIDSQNNTKDFIGHALKEIKIPPGCLVAMLRRDKHTIVPKGETVLQEGDRLTIIGDSRGLQEMQMKYLG